LSRLHIPSKSVVLRLADQILMMAAVADPVEHMIYLVHGVLRLFPQEMDECGEHRTQPLDSAPSPGVRLIVSLERIVTNRFQRLYADFMFCPRDLVMVVVHGSSLAD
jgi:hypothetical protein